MLRLGLTGGIGSGKSTAAKLLEKCGATVIDADAISRNLTAQGGLAIPKIIDVFGADFVMRDGALNRDKMRTAAFASHDAKNQLEAILHPMVGAEISCQADAALNAGCPCLVYDIPLLVESSHWRRQFDKVLVIDCSHGVQVQRVQIRSGLPVVAIEGIIANQAPRQARLQASDYVICNDTIDLIELQAQVNQLWHWLGLTSPSDLVSHVEHRNSA